MDFHALSEQGIVLENGLADARDKYRANFIRDHLRYIHKAIQEGVDVRGYFHWSFARNLPSG
jgi:beta-glucosidase/6-phospho-beta-glucosidase/beta-galactosidase